MLQFLLEDPLNGVIGCAIATLGVQAANSSSPRYLPSYIVLSFCNGTMQVLLGLEFFTWRHMMSVILGPLTMGKVASAVAVAAPSLMFVGLVLAWKLQVEVRGLPVQDLGELQPQDGGPSPAAAGGDQPVQPLAAFRPFSGAPRRLEPARA